MPKKNTLITHYSLFIVLFIALVLRLVSINQSLWLDEAISVETVTKYSLADLFSKFLPNDFNPPLYYLILHFWLKLFPATEFFIRLPSVIFGILTCVLVYKIYRYLFKNKKQAIFASLLLGTAPLHIYYSQEARAYSLTAFLVSASMYYFLKLLKEKKFLATSYYFPATILMLYSHYLSWLILPVQWIYFYVSKKWKNKKIILNFSISQFLNFFFLLPFLPIFLKQLKSGRGVAEGSSVWRNVLGGLTFKNIALLPIKFIIGRTSFENKLLYGFIVLLLGLFFSFLLLQTRKIQRKERKIQNFIWFWLIVPLALGVFVSFKIPVFSYFRFLFCLPAFYLLVAKGVFLFKKPKLLIFTLLLINFFFSLKYLLNQNYHRENWKKAVKILHQKNAGNQPVLIIQNVSAPFDYYDRGVSKKVFAFQKDAIVGFETVWLIPYAQPILDPQNETRSFLKNNGFSRIYEEHFRGVTLEKWQKLLAKN